MAGRGPDFTPEEDAILLETVGRPADEVNERLMDAGFPARSANALKQRRYYLKTQGVTSSEDAWAAATRLRNVLTHVEDDGKNHALLALVELMAEQDALLRRKHAAEETLVSVEEKLEHIQEQLLEAVKDAQEALEPENTATVGIDEG